MEREHIKEFGQHPSLLVDLLIIAVAGSLLFVSPKVGLEAGPPCLQRGIAQLAMTRGQIQTTTLNLTRGKDDPVAKTSFSKPLELSFREFLLPNRTNSDQFGLTF